MNFGEAMDIALRIAVALGVPGAVVWFVRDRRKSRASAEVAEGTVPAEISLANTGALSAQVAAMVEAFRVERESKDRHIKEQDQQIAELTDEVRRLKAGRRDDAERIAALRDEVADLKTQVQLLISSRLTEDPKESP